MLALPISPDRVKVIALCASFALCAVGARHAAAIPSDEIRHAVTAGGAAEVATAASAKFVRAFSALLARVPAKTHPDYVTAAIKLRSDLAPEITVAALHAHRRPRNDVVDSCDWIDAIIRAAIAAAPPAKEAIVRAAVKAEPFAQKCIFAAAGIQDDVQTAFLQLSGIDAGNINSSSLGTINPANISGQGNVVSPFQP